MGDRKLQAKTVSAKAKLGEVISYALTRWEGLSRFLDGGRIDLPAFPIAKHYDRAPWRGVADGRPTMESSLNGAMVSNVM